MFTFRPVLAYTHPVTIASLHKNLTQPFTVLGSIRLGSGVQSVGVWNDRFRLSALLIQVIKGSILLAQGIGIRSFERTSL